ncbi:hypothetical protein DSL92_07710 [Billgrantia gudaonensis]|uniref:AMP-binding enzyme C-terminal domain-containing protein n=1 Tax=Billgrantia gudaonensis TaxID=376427 RepID=A0A3S0VSH3_9GAMM|nr:hypothetical protein DSL92_07710 [Halomonas gudaonensis]
MSVFDVFRLAGRGRLNAYHRREEKDAIHWNRLVREHGVSDVVLGAYDPRMLLACQRERFAALAAEADRQGGDYIKPTTITRRCAAATECQAVLAGRATETTIWSIWHEMPGTTWTSFPTADRCRAIAISSATRRRRTVPVGRGQDLHRRDQPGARLPEGRRTPAERLRHVVRRARPAGRAFRTGDLGRYRRDGAALRRAGQRLREGAWGRMSLPDIENELSGHPGVRQVLVVDHVAQSGETALGALYVAAGDDRLPCQAEGALRGTICPNPTARPTAICVAALPLSGNGKPDRQEARRILTTAVDASSPVRCAAPLPAGRCWPSTVRSSSQARSGTLPRALGFPGHGLLPSHLQAIASRLDGRSVCVRRSRR